MFSVFSLEADATVWPLQDSAPSVSARLPVKRDWPKYKFGHVFSYTIVAQATRLEKKLEFGSAFLGYYPLGDASLVNSWRSMKRRVHSRSLVKQGTARQAVCVNPPRRWVVLSDGAAADPYMLTVEYERTNRGDEGYSTAIAQFFISEYPRRDATSANTAQAPAWHTLVQDRILIRNTADQDDLSFQVIGDKDLDTPSCFVASRPTYIFHVPEEDHLIDTEYLRDGATGFLDLWSPSWFPSVERVWPVHQFVPCDPTPPLPMPLAMTANDGRQSQA